MRPNCTISVVCLLWIASQLEQILPFFPGCGFEIIVLERKRRERRREREESRGRLRRHVTGQSRYREEGFFAKADCLCGSVGEEGTRGELNCDRVSSSGSSASISRIRIEKNRHILG